MRLLFSLCLALILGACAGDTGLSDGLPRGTNAYAEMPASSAANTTSNYRIGPLDQIDIFVFQEPDLSFKDLQVDAAGQISMPLIGSVQASGKTGVELANEIEHRLGERFLMRPQVTVSVSGSVSQKVSVQGEVVEPGVYPLKGPTTLLEAVSLAKGETKVAALRDVAIFRVHDGKRVGAVFDMNAIRKGTELDPAIVGNDIVVVGYSRRRGAWRDLLQTAPLISVAAFLLR